VDPYVAANRDNWDERVPIHTASRFYDVQGWLAQGRSLRRGEVEALGDVAGLDLVHLQCHFGLDTLTLARHGAQVTGLDFSGAAITEARSIAERAGLSHRSRFVEADVLEAAAALAPETYDLAYVSPGSLCWLPSIERWAGQVAALLRPGGRLYLHDDHPLSWALSDTDPLRIDRSYFEEPDPDAEEDDVTYTDGDDRLANTRCYVWNHSIGEIVTAVLDSGLELVSLTEHDWAAWPRFPSLVSAETGRWKAPAGHPRLALSFTLLARRGPA